MSIISPVLVDDFLYLARRMPLTGFKLADSDEFRSLMSQIERDYNVEPDFKSDIETYNASRKKSQQTIFNAKDNPLSPDATQLYLQCLEWMKRENVLSRFDVLIPAQIKIVSEDYDLFELNIKMTEAFDTSLIEKEKKEFLSLYLGREAIERHEAFKLLEKNQIFKPLYDTLTYITAGELPETDFPLLVRSGNNNINLSPTIRIIDEKIETEKEIVLLRTRRLPEKEEKLLLDQLLGLTETYQKRKEREHQVRPELNKPVTLLSLHRNYL